MSPRIKNLARIAALLAGVLACAATSAPQYRWDRAYPKWQVPPTSVQAIDCARVQTWISKTAKRGVGISLLVTTSEPQCQVEIESMLFAVGSETRSPTALPPSATVRNDSPVHFYFPVVFENETFWNQGKNKGEIALVVRAGDGQERIVLEARQTRNAPHVRVGLHQPHQHRAEENRQAIRTISTIADAPLELVPRQQ